MDFYFKAISIDDSQEDVEHLKKAFEQNPTFHFEGNALTMSEGKKLLQSVRPDLLFLDIELPDANGLDAVSEIKSMVNWPMMIVFYTVFDSYVIDALRKSAFDYLVKPLNEDDLSDMLRRFEIDYKTRFLKTTSPAVIPEKNLPIDASPALSEPVFMVNTIIGYKRIFMHEVVYLEHIKSSKYWRICLTDGTSHTLRKDTSAQDVLTMSPLFAQVNQSQIINLNFLGILKRESCSLLPPYENIVLSVSRSYLPILQNRLLFI